MCSFYVLPDMWVNDKNSEVSMGVNLFFKPVYHDDNNTSSLPGIVKVWKLEFMACYSMAWANGNHSVSWKPCIK